jgi:prevent-host-death family protein
MKSSVGSFEAKTHLVALLGRVAQGERITITRHGNPIARLVPVEPETKSDVKAVVEAMRAFQEKNGPVLGDGLTTRDFIEEGRRY